MGDVVVEDVRNTFDIESTSGDIGGDQDVDRAVLEGGDGSLPLRLSDVSVDRRRRKATGTKLSATSSVACLVRTKMIIASNGSTSRTRVSASIFRGPATWM